MIKLERIPTYALASLLALLVFVAYSNSFQAGFVFDSSVILLEDTRLRGISFENLGLIWSQSYWFPTSTSDLYRPVTTLSYWVNYSLLGNGENPTWYHAVNLFLHLLNALIAWSIVERLTGRRRPAFLLAALWAVHPATTEAVTNLVGRADLLTAFGTLSALRVWQSGHGRAWLEVGLAAAIAIFSKEGGVAVVGVLAWYTLLFEPRTIWWSRAKQAVVVTLPIALFLYQRQQVVTGVLDPNPFTDNPIAGAGFWVGRLTALAVLGEYFRVALFPVRLSSDYSYNQIPLASGTWTEWVTWSALAVMAVGVGYVCWRHLRRSHSGAVIGTASTRRAKTSPSRTAAVNQPQGVTWEPLLLMAVGFAAITFLPGSNLLFATGTIMGERLLYLPLLGFLGAVMLGLSGVVAYWPRTARVAPAFISILLALCMFRTWTRNRDWHTEVALWTSAALAVPNSFKAHQGLADALFEANPDDLDRVIAESDRSVAILDRLVNVRPRIAWVATPFAYRRAADYHLRRGDMFRAAGREPDQRVDYERALQLATTYRHILDGDPEVSIRVTRERGEANVLVADIQARLGRSEDAIASALRGQEQEPTDPNGYRVLASALFEANRDDEAMKWLLAGFTVTGDPTLRQGAIDFYRAHTGRYPCALKLGAGGPSLDPACEPVRQHLCAGSLQALAVDKRLGRNDLVAQLEGAVLGPLKCGG